MNIFQNLAEWFKREKPWKFKQLDRKGAADLLDSFANKDYCRGEYEFFDIYLRDEFSDPLLARVASEFRRIQSEFEATGGNAISVENLALLRTMSAELRASKETPDE